MRMNRAQSHCLGLLLDGGDELPLTPALSPSAGETESRSPSGVFPLSPTEGERAGGRGLLRLLPKHALSVAALLTCSLAAGSALGANTNEIPVTIALDTTHPGAAIPPDFTGLSFEVAQLRPGPNGLRYFRPDNAPLLDLFHTLG